MELSVKIIIICATFTCLLAEVQLHHHSQSTGRPLNLTDYKEGRAVKLRKHILECTEETNVNPDLVLNLRSRKWKQTLKKSPPTLKQWSLCLLVKSDMMTPDGVLKQDVVLAHVPKKDKAKVENVIDQCLFKKSHLPSEIAWHYITCFRNRFAKYSII